MREEPTTEMLRLMILNDIINLYQMTDKLRHVTPEERDLMKLKESELRRWIKEGALSGKENGN